MSGDHTLTVLPRRSLMTYEGREVRETMYDVRRDLQVLIFTDGTSTALPREVLAEMRHGLDVYRSEMAVRLVPSRPLAPLRRPEGPKEQKLTRVVGHYGWSGGLARPRQRSKARYWRRPI